MLSNTLVKNKLRITFSIIAFLLLLTSIMFIFIVKSINENAEDLYDHPYTVTSTILEVKADIRHLYSVTEEITETADPSIRQTLIDESESLETEILTGIRVIHSFYLGNPEDIQEIEDEFMISNKNRDTAIALTIAGEYDQAFTYRLTTIKNQTDILIGDINVVEDFAKAKAIELRDQNERLTEVYNIVVVTSILGVVIISIILFFTITSNVFPALQRILDTIRTQGKSSVKLDLERRDEIGEISRNLNSMLANIKTDSEISELNLKLSNLRDKENLRITLMSIGDGVITTDLNGIITNINPVASSMTGFLPVEAVGKNSNDVFNIVNKYTRDPVASPIERVINEGRIVGLANHTVLISKDGSEYDISDSGAPIIDENGAIFGVVVVFRDVTKEYASRKEIEYLSWHDALTGLNNRNHLEKLVLTLQESKAKNVGIIMGDVNGLKITNDAFGHSFGDKLLIEISTILKTSTPKGTTIVRWGGDEFVIVIENVTQDKLDIICGNITKKCFNYDSKSPVKPSISLGHAVLDNNDQNLYRTLIRAEDMMYENKLLDKNSLRSVIVTSLETSLYEKSYETEEHALRVAGYSEIIAKKIELHQNEINNVILLSKLHDIGKISIDDSVLLKRGKLNSEEWKTIKKHPETGYRIASSLNDLTHIAEGILCHHEFYNGNGYPRGLKGEEIPVQARIVSIADAFDVMITERNYKKTMSKEDAIEELIRCKGTQFDPKLVDVFVPEIQD